MELILNDEEREFLLNVLERRHQELLNEIVHTDRREFKQELRRSERLVDSLANRLHDTAVQEVHG